MNFVSSLVRKFALGFVTLSLSGPLFPFAFATAAVLGVEQMDQVQEKLAHARGIALVVHAASISKHGHTIDYLLRLGLPVKKLFALEHGVRGDRGAGVPVEDSIDQLTGLPVVSLYGSVKKPTPQMLNDVDWILYDVQDVGVRFFTYITSLGYLLEAAKENRKKFLLLDRPNPNGDYVAGPVLKESLFSFVGQYPIPIVYGLSAGELARMIVGENWLNTKGVKLQILAMKEYAPSRDMIFPRAPPSPGLKSSQSIRFYPSIALFEATHVSLGRGTENSFAQFGHPNLQNFFTHSFTPLPNLQNPNPLHKNVTCWGDEVFSKSIEEIPRFGFNFFIRVRDTLGIAAMKIDRRFLSLLVGDTAVVQKLESGSQSLEIEALYQEDLKKFRKLSEKYFLYSRSEDGN